ncbi:CPBP family intramembrane glutamic endopeptidase [Marinilactibacillus psychrotolerans]|uniref:CPBP family intramembrane glutamic endopeptidase n=1 Tax=Marinilactibacillus psychrotolerans TaxID=191770 RepID=UPI0039B0B209
MATIKSIIFILIWLFTSLFLKYGFLRSTILINLTTNNLILYKVLFTIFIFTFYFKLLIIKLKELKIKTIYTYSLGFSIIALLVNFILTVSLFGDLLFNNYSITIFSVVYTLVITPIYEEFIYRFLFLNTKKSIKNNSIIIILSSILFAYGHLYSAQGNAILLVQFFILAILFSFVYLKTKNIYYSILMHFFYNLMILFLFNG